jgi:hypothetical protein
LDTVLGLSLTSASVGWVLVEGHDADGAIVDHDDLEVRSGVGLRAVRTSEQAMTAVLDAQAAAGAYDQRLRVIGVTWSDETAAEAALLLEALTNAGFDNVVPVQLQQACEMLARGIAPVVGFDQAAVCVLDGESTIVVMVDTCDDEPQTAVKHLPGGTGRLVQWLTTLFDRSSWQPGGIVVVGADEDLDAVSRRLEQAVPVPVVTQTATPLALARGAALASAQSTEFTDTDIAGTINAKPGDRTGSRQHPYAGALTMLVAGAVTFVASLSLAVGPHLVPDRPHGPVRQVVHKVAAPPVVVQTPAPLPAAVTPAAKPTPQPAPAHRPTEAPEPAQTVVSQNSSAGLPAAAPVPPPAPPPPVAPPPPPEPNPHPLLTKLLERLHGHPDDQAPPPPGAPPGPPPNPGAPPP